MLNLMRLEMKKFHLGSYVRGAIIANLVILGFLFMILFISKVEGGSRARKLRGCFKCH